MSRTKILVVALFVAIFGMVAVQSASAGLFGHRHCYQQSYGCYQQSRGCGHSHGCGQSYGCGHSHGCGQSYGCGHSHGCGQSYGCGQSHGCGCGQGGAIYDQGGQGGVIIQDQGGPQGDNVPSPPMGDNVDPAQDAPPAAPEPEAANEAFPTPAQAASFRRVSFRR